MLPVRPMLLNTTEYLIPANMFDCYRIFDTRFFVHFFLRHSITIQAANEEETQRHHYQFSTFIKHFAYRTKINEPHINYD